MAWTRWVVATLAFGGGCGVLNFEEIHPADVGVVFTDADFVDASNQLDAFDAGSDVMSLDVSSDAGPIDVAADIPTDAGGSILVQNLAPDWTTPNSIRWTWERSGEEVDFQSYELWVATTEAALRGPVGGVDRFTAAENPELGEWTLPRSSTDVLFSVTDGHEPSSQYWAKLIATDNVGRTVEIFSAGARTGSAPTQEIAVWSEAPTPGFSIPADFVHETANGYMSVNCYAYTRDCTDACFENLRRHNIDADISAADLDTAYFEYAVRISGATDHTYFGQMRIMLGDSVDNTLHHANARTFRAGDVYRVYQFPISEFGAVLTLADLQRPLFEWGVGASWVSDVTVRIDEVRLRW